MRLCLFLLLFTNIIIVTTQFLHEKSTGSKSVSIRNTHKFGLHTQRKLNRNSVLSDKRHNFEELPQHKKLAKIRSNVPNLNTKQFLIQNYKRTANEIRNGKNVSPSLFGSNKIKRYFTQRKSFPRNYRNKAPLQRKKAFSYNPNSKIKEATNPRPVEWRRQIRLSDQQLHLDEKNYPDPEPNSREKKSLTSEKVDGGYTLKSIKLILFFIPLASILAILMTVVHYFWNKRNPKIHKANSKSLERSKSPRVISESTVGSALTDNTQLSSSKSLDVMGKFVTNDFDAEGDIVAKRMKLERWMYQDPRYLPGMAQRQMKHNKGSHNRPARASHGRDSSDSRETTSSETNSPSQRVVQPRQKAPNQTNQNQASSSLKRSENREAIKSQKDIPPSRGPNLIVQNHTHIPGIRRSESETAGRVARDGVPESVQKASSDLPVISSRIENPWDKSNSPYDNSINKNKHVDNHIMTDSLITFNSHYVPIDRIPVQRYNYTLRGNMDGQKRNSEPFSVIIKP